MSRLLFAGAFVLGALAVAWTGAGFIGANALALAVTAVIGIVYLIGFAELCQFRRATGSLDRALAALPRQPCASGERLAAWLGELDPSLRHALRRRVQGHRVPLPTPAVTPYLVGLLVMLGLLGTFVGLVDTLRGAVQALEASTELAAIRAGIAAPMQGLSLAFGTSVAGVASSAMLGLGSTLSRRDRLQLVAKLDAGVDAAFGALSLDHGRLAAFQALERQAEALPAVAARLDALAERLEQRSAVLDARLGEGQERFHAAAERSYRELAAAVDRSLRESMAHSGREAAEGIRPVVAEAMAAVRVAAEGTQDKLAATATGQLEALGEAFRAATSSVLADLEATTTAWMARQAAADGERWQHWATGAERVQQQAAAQAVAASDTLADAFRQLGERQAAAFAGAARASESLSDQLSDQWREAGGRVERLTAALTGELAALREQEAQRCQTTAAHLAALETAAATRLAELGRTLEEPMRELLQSAADGPRAAAAVLAELRQQGSRVLERDNQLLDERRQTMAALAGLAGSLSEATAGQRAAVEQFVAASAGQLDAAGERFAGLAQASLEQVEAATDDIAASAAELTSLGEAFALALQRFGETTGGLAAGLAGVGEALERSATRSDEQMAYYVAQAREIIDHSLLAQQGVIDQLRNLGLEFRRAAPEEV